MTVFNYQKTGRFFAQIADGMEELGTGELSDLGAEDINAGYRGLYFSADKASLYKINYCARFITRVLAPLITFDCHSTKYLYKTARTINWPDIFSLEKTFVISANVSNSHIRHSQYAALCLKDAIVDCFRDTYDKRPDVERINPDIGINLYINNNKATIYIDTSGGSLHRRGYRRDSVEAPMQETLAAAVIELSGWDGQDQLYDPMCGSGTLLFEALMSYCRIPSGYFRENFGFAFLPDFDKAVWKRVKRLSDSNIRELPRGLIAGSDASGTAIASARKNADNIKGGHRITFSKKPFQDLDSLNNATIVCNPPYGMRIGKNQDMVSFIKDFGDFLKQRCTGSRAYVYFGKRELIKSLGLHASWKKPLKNGQLDGRLVKYDLY